ncbi:hypothetical protein DXA74_11550 [Bacteroides sp. OF04-15BH]|nr:hypothetical protein DXA74_11550 [Bacteroides sp. OF04-15BH]
MMDFFWFFNENHNIRKKSEKYKEKRKRKSCVLRKISLRKRTKKCIFEGTYASVLYGSVA